MSDYISTADELELLSDVLSEVHLSPRDSDMASIQGSSRSTSESSSAHETSADYDDTGEQDDVYNNRAANYYYGDRSLLKKSQKTVPYGISSVVQDAYKETYRKFKPKVGPWIPIGMSSNNKNIQLDEILLTWLYCVTGNIPYRHAAVACGLKRSKICEICQFVPRILKENGFIEEFIRLPTEEEALRSARKFTERHGLPTIFGLLFMEPMLRFGLKQKTKLRIGIDIQN